MAKEKSYEIRPRGQFIEQGRIIEAKNPMDAIQKILGYNNIGSMVIETDIEGDWYLISKNGHFSQPTAFLGNTMLRPGDRDPEERLVLAKACERELQNDEDIPNMGFSDFNYQLNKYYKANGFVEENFVKNQQQYKKEATEATSQCLEECALVEVAINNEDTESVWRALTNAKHLLLKTNILAEASHTPGDTKPNSAEVAANNAKKQFDKVNEKNKIFRKKVIFIGQSGTKMSTLIRKNQNGQKNPSLKASSFDLNR